MRWLDYPHDEYPFAAHVSRMMFPGADYDHDDLDSTRQRLASLRAGRPAGAETTAFVEVYKRFVRDVIRPSMEEEVVIFEANPNLRILTVGGKALTGSHKDADWGHVPQEINFWLPLVQVYGSNSLWLESDPGRGDFQPACGDVGQVLRFYGNQCLHFSRDNCTDTTRVSLDFRVVRGRDFAASGLRTRGNEADGGCEHTIFSYYSVMGPGGELTRDEWAAVSGQALASHVPAPWLPPTVTVSLEEGRGSRVRPTDAKARQRSSSLEHRQRCEAAWGSEREARKRCARCGWLENRAKLSRQLCFEVAKHSVPWIAESDMHLPWALGCVLCRAARRKGGIIANHVQHDAFAEFTFGPGLQGRDLFQPLFRHGNHAKKQVDVRVRMVQLDAGHEAAVAAARSGELVVSASDYTAC